MPIQLNEETGGKVLAVHVSGKLAKADYEHFVPEFERLVKLHGKLRVLFDMTGFHGWEVGALWDDLYAAGAEVIVNGHDHDYERFAPQAPSGAADAAKGIRQFVVGTGGAALRSFATIRANSQVRNGVTHGAIKLTLDTAGYTWQFIPAGSGTFTDSGSGTCH